MEYTEAVNLITNPALRDLALLLSILIPSFIGIWNLTHTKATAQAVTPNHGSSLADSVRRQETQNTEIREELGELRDLITQHILTDTPCEAAHHG